METEWESFSETTANKTDKAGLVHLSGPTSIRGPCRLLLPALQGPIGEYPSLTPYLGLYGAVAPSY